MACSVLNAASTYAGRVHGPSGTRERPTHRSAPAVTTSSTLQHTNDKISPTHCLVRCRRTTTTTFAGGTWRLTTSTSRHWPAAFRIM